MCHDVHVSAYVRVKTWKRTSLSSAALVLRDVAPLIRPRPGWLSTSAGVVLTLTAWNAAHWAGGITAGLCLLVAEWRVTK